MINPGAPYPPFNPPDAPDTGELNKLLDSFSELCEDNRHAPENCRCREVVRQSLTDLFERLQNRIAELEREIKERDADFGALEDMNAALVERLAELDGLSIDYGNLLTESTEFEAELSALRSTALTRDEAAAILNQPVAFMGPKLSPELIAKLKALSSLRSSSLGEQTLTRGND